MTTSEFSRIDEWFAATALLSPQAIAVTDDRESLTYEGLDIRSAAVADALGEAGVPHGSLIALKLPRTTSIPVAILGVFKHGCAYVPIDPLYPAERQRFLLEDSRAQATLEVTESGQVTVSLTRHSGHELPRGLAYVIYTSGSTGLPKGVMVGHRQVISLLRAAHEHFRFRSDDTWSLFSAYSFDVSVWEMWGALLFGGRLAVLPATCVKDPGLLAEFLEKQKVTILNQVPSAFTYLVRALEDRPRPLQALRAVIFAGEDLNKDSIRRWWKLQAGSSADLVNMYGITETTVHATYELLKPETLDGWEGHSPIGSPLAHLAMTLVDDEGKTVSVGEPGEIIVAGAGLAFGYLNREELTRQRFVSRDGSDQLSYRSGDWARQDESGKFFFIGRRDFQVQVRGFRIELGEIEARISEHPDVEACVVTAPANALGEPVLTAHIVRSRGSTTEVADLRRFLASTLPGHMVPARFAFRASLPLTHNGKVDRQALDAHQ